MEKYNIEKVFNRYVEVEALDKADIFHLYDTGRECKIDNSGYWDSRHFRLMIFNTKTMEKCDMGIHDGLSIEDGVQLKLTRIFADGSTLLRFSKPANIINGQSVTLWL